MRLITRRELAKTARERYKSAVTKPDFDIYEKLLRTLDPDGVNKNPDYLVIRCHKVFVQWYDYAVRMERQRDSERIKRSDLWSKIYSSEEDFQDFERDVFEAMQELMKNRNDKGVFKVILEYIENG